MNKSTIRHIVTVLVFVFGAQAVSALAPTPQDVKTHPADPPDNRIPPPNEMQPVQPPAQPVDSGKGKAEPTNTFDALDTNRDGYLTRVEFAVNNAPASDFERFDTDHDGRLSKEEWLRSQSPLNSDR